MAPKWRHTLFYIRPNNLPQELFFETRLRDLEFDIDVLTTAKFKKNLAERFRENYEFSFKASKYNQNKAVLNVMANYVF